MEGAAYGQATGLENRWAVKRRGSIPSPSAVQQMITLEQAVTAKHKILSLYKGTRVEIKSYQFGFYLNVTSSDISLSNLMPCSIDGVSITFEYLDPEEVIVIESSD